LKYYTGVGARDTPDDILKLMKSIAIFLESIGFILRSGGAKGADAAFESGAGNQKEIFYAKDATQESMNLAARYHPIFNKLPEYVQKLHGRNSFQVLGKDLKTPSNFLICWTKDGCKNHKERSNQTGGTGTAISIASENGITIYNLENQRDRQTINLVVKSMTSD
jgi:hypothetical protein